MELIIALAMKFWQWTVLIAVVIIAAIINFTDKRAKTKMKFNFKIGFLFIFPKTFKHRIIGKFRIFEIRKN